MSDEELEVLITIDDPWYGPDEDTFHHLQPDTTETRIIPETGGHGVPPLQ